jgi:hypothetical protein
VGPSRPQQLSTDSVQYLIVPFRLRFYTERVSDDSPQETLARLKEASDALDAAQDASQITAQEIARDQRADGNATLVINGIHQPKRKFKRPT